MSVCPSGVQLSSIAATVSETSGLASPTPLVAFCMITVGPGELMADEPQLVPPSGDHKALVIGWSL